MTSHTEPSIIVGPIGGHTMELSEQHLLVQQWGDFLGSRAPTNTLLREFYLDVVKSSDVYAYGVVYEVFDFLTNGVFDLAAAATWNQQMRAESSVEAA